MADDPRRDLPAIDSLLNHPDITATAGEMAPGFVAFIARQIVSEARAKVGKGKNAPSEDSIIHSLCREIGDLKAMGPRHAINATGVVLHTGLGRAPLCEDARRAIISAAGYCNLEIDLSSGERGDRQSHLEKLLCILTGAEAALVVNNNAAALYLVLNALAYRREVVVSRGQLIEIGGSFRLPDIMQRSGVHLVEVGTTNRTRIEDYRNAISSRTALLLRAHPSNYRVVGFTESVSIGDLIALGRENKLPVVEDLGNGLLWDWKEFGLPKEENVQASLKAGADLVLVSGDKVLGGPQAGIIVGKRAMLSRLRKNPLARVLRTDKLTVAALAATLRQYLNPRHVPENIPVWRMLAQDTAHLADRAARLKDRLAPLTKWVILEVCKCVSEAGSGTLPAVSIPSVAICMLPASMHADKWSRRLRASDVPVFATVRDERVWFDMRTISDSDEDDLIRSVSEALKK